MNELCVLSDKRILSEQALIFFDETQAAPKSVTALKYFCVSAPKYHIVTAGSLFGIAVNREPASFSVGKIDGLMMNPMNIYEFLLATGNDALAQLIGESYDSDVSLL